MKSIKRIFALLLALFVGTGSAMSLGSHRPYFPNARISAAYFSEIPADMDNAVDWLVFQVDYPDYFYL